MWVPKSVIDWFQISKDSIDHMREDLASIRAERDGLKAQLAQTSANFDWARIRLNALEIERAQLLEKAYNIRIPVPEIARSTPITDQIADINSFSFDHIDEDVAKKLGVAHLLS